MSLTVLNVAYPFAPVGPEAVGGAEQVVSTLDAYLTRSGRASWVVACEGSRVLGTLRTVPRGDVASSAAMQATRALYQRRIEETIEEARPDLVHFHGLDFFDYLPRKVCPTLVSLHLPCSFYSERALRAAPRHVRFCCVSEAQRRSAPAWLAFGPVLSNGVPLERFQPSEDKGDYLLLLSRVCPEKGVHLALELSHALDLPLLIAGAVYPYPSHERYFREQVLPRLDARRRFLGPVGFPEKAALLARARCLVVPSLVDETSSLVSMEALASGTPVVAFRRGALPETVEHGVTGFVVDTMAQLAEAVRETPRIDPRVCRRVAERRFSAEVMGARHVTAYRALSAQGTPAARGRPREPLLRVEEITQRGEAEAFEGAWRALWEQCPQASVFQRPEWLLAWWKHLLSGAPLLLVFRRGAELVGVAPCFAWEQQGARVLSLMGAGVSDYQDLLARRDVRADVRDAFAAYLRTCGVQRCAFSELVPGSLLREVAERVPARVTCTPQEACPAISLPAARDPLAAALPSSFWARVRYAERRAEREGYVRELAGAAEFPGLLHALSTLHSERREQLRQTPAFRVASFAAFQRDALSALHAAGVARLFGLRRAGEQAWLGALLAFEDRDTLRYYLGGFAAHIARLSPGTLLIARALRYAVERGARCFDFMRGDEPYKYTWGASARLTLERQVVELR